MNGWYDQIEKLAESGDITPEVFHSLMLVAIKDIAAMSLRQDAILEDTERKMEAIKDNLKEMKERQAEYPSTSWLLRYEPKKTIVAIVLIVAVALFLIGVIDEIFLRQFIRALLGLP